MLKWIQDKNHNTGKKIGNYVIVHELLHFSVPNHGRLWKSLMRAHLGDYEIIEARLKKIAEKKHIQAERG